MNSQYRAKHCFKMTSVEDDTMEKQERNVPGAVLSPRPSGGTITQFEFKEECPSIETSYTSGNSEEAIKLASQKHESCVSPILEPRTRIQKIKDALTLKKPLGVTQIACFILSLISLICRLYITNKELMAEFCLLCLSIMLCVVITMYYDRGYYAKSVFEDSHPRKAFVDSPEYLGMAHLKSADSDLSVYAKFDPTASTSGHARALVHPPPANMPESPIAISANSDARAIPGPSGLQKLS